MATKHKTDCGCAAKKKSTCSAKNKPVRILGLFGEKPCPCGSGLPSTWVKDSRGIPLKRTCDKCHIKMMKTYRPEVLTNPNYWADEPIEEDHKHKNRK